MPAPSTAIQNCVGGINAAPCTGDDPVFPCANIDGLGDGDLCVETDLWFG